MLMVLLFHPLTVRSLPAPNKKGRKHQVFYRLYRTLLFSNEAQKGIVRFRVDTLYLAAIIKGTMFSVSITPKGSPMHVTESLVQVVSIVSGQTRLRNNSVAFIRGNTRISITGGTILGTVASKSQVAIMAMSLGENGAGEEIRTLDFNLGKVALYP